MFKISTKTRYGLRALLEMSKHEQKKPVKLLDISKNQKISFKYLELIFNLLKNNNIVRSKRGANGGYILVKKPENLSLYEIITAINGPLNIADCIMNPEICLNALKCPANTLWNELQENISEFFKSKTLKDVISSKERILK